MLCPGGCNNSYLVRGDQWTCYDTLSRARPRFPLFIPVPDKHYGVTRAGLYTKRLRTYLRGSVMQEQHLPVHSSIFALSKDQENIVECFESDFFHSKPFLGDLIVQNRYYFLSEGTVCAPDEGANFTYRYQPVEEPWLLDQHGSSHYAAEDFDVSNDLTDGNGIFKFHPIGRSKSELSSESLRCGADSYSVSGKVGHQVNIESSSGWWSFSRDDPVEDPWLIYPSPDVLGTDIELVADPPPISESAEDGRDPLDIQELQHQVTEKLLSEIKTNLLGELVADPPPISESAEDGQNPLGIKEQQHQGTEKLLPEIKTYLLSCQDFASIEILINCSICTMQRIAVLEDGNLVELLLEPVKSDVQCDSVYLGVVTKLVPNMGGAFVNIGSSCFMDIQHTREPFIFPPFNCNTKEKDVNGSLSTMPQKHLDSSQSELASLDNNDTFFDEDTEVDLDEDDFDDHETEYDMDVEKIPERNFTSCVVNDNGTSAHAGDSVNQLNGEVDHAKAQSHARGRKGTNNRWMAKQVWAQVREGTRIIVQVVKEGLGKKSPKLTPYPVLTNRFWILITRCDRVRVSPKISGVEHTRLKHIAKSLQPHGFGVTVRPVAAGRSMEELQKDLNSLLSTWRNITERAKSASLAADEGVEGAVPVILHQAMCQTLSVVQNYFNEKVKRMVVDSPRTYHEVTNYLQNVAPELCDRVELHRKKIPLFDEFNIEEEINNILNKRVALPNGGYLVIEQTEALVSIGVNGGHGMFVNGASQEKAILDVNLSAAKQVSCFLYLGRCGIARELRLRDIGGIIIVDFIDMMDEMNKRLVYEEVKKAVARDCSMVNVSELSKNGLMEIIRKRVRPSVTFMISEPCTCCQGTGRVSALETDFSKIERKICRLLATSEQKSDPKNPKCWRRLSLRVDSCMWDYLTSGKKTRLATLSSSLKVWIHLQVERTFTRGVFEVKLFVDEKAIDDQHHQGDVAVSEQQETKTSMSTSRAKLFPIKKLKGARK